MDPCESSGKSIKVVTLHQDSSSPSEIHEPQELVWCEHSQVWTDRQTPHGTCAALNVEQETPMGQDNALTCSLHWCYWRGN